MFGVRERRSDRGLAVEPLPDSASADTSAGRILSASRPGSLELLGQVHLPQVPGPSGRTILKPANVAPPVNGMAGYCEPPPRSPAKSQPAPHTIIGTLSALSILLD